MENTSIAWQNEVHVPDGELEIKSVPVLQLQLEQYLRLKYNAFQIYNHWEKSGTSSFQKSL